MEQKLRQLIKEAMLLKKETGNANRYQTFKNILEKAQKLAKDNRQEVVTNSMITDAAKKEIKQLEDLLSYCTEGSDKYNETMECISYAKELLPQMVSAEAIMDYLIALQVEKNMGICMKTLKAHYQNTLDGKIASTVVKEYLSK